MDKSKLRFRMARMANNLTQKAVAAKLGITQQTIVGHEKGNSECSYAFLEKYSQLYNCSIDYLLGVNSNVNPTVNLIVQAVMSMPAAQQEQLKNFALYLASNPNPQQSV